MKDLTFKLRTKARPVTIEGDGGEETKYEIRELKAAARDKYMDNLSKRLILDSKGNVVGLRKYEGMQADLLTICLFKEGATAPVQKQELDAWPSSTVTLLFQAAQEINLFRKPDERNRLAAEQIVKFLAKRDQEGAVGDLDPSEIEGVIDETDRKMFEEQKDGGEDQADG